MQWDDLRYVLAVHRAGSLAGAARLLKISHVTVFRRVEAIEKDLGVRLFDRKQQGYVPTPAAREILLQAEQIEDQINALERRAWRQDSEIRGSVRITAAATMAMTVLPGMIGKLQRVHPQLVIELDSSDVSMNIAKRDADIAVRHTNSPPEMLIGHPLTPVDYAVYASRKMAARYRRKGDFAAFPWVAPEELPVDQLFNDWIRAKGLEPQVRLRSNSWLGMATAVRDGAGLGLLSCWSASYVGGVTRLTDPIRELRSHYWILTHPELRDVARVATVSAFIRAEFAGLQPWFEGRR